MNIMQQIYEFFCGKCNCNKEYCIERIESLTNELASTIETTIFPKTETTIKPRHFWRKCIETGDLIYLTYPTEIWMECLDKLNSISDMQYRKKIFDCDNFALTYAASVSVSAYHSGLPWQPAFGICWSRTHAFNFFVTDENELIKYEPQSGTIIISGDPDYKIVKMWIMG